MRPYAASMVLDDLRYAWRAVRARPVFALTVVSLMALTIGANAAIFSLIDTVLLSALPFRDPSRLVVVNGTRGDDQQEPFSIPDYVDVARQTRAFEALVRRSNGAQTSPAAKPSGCRA